MGIRYDLSAAEILKGLGYEEKTGRERLNAFLQEKGISIPKVYREFMETAMDCPMLETADLWVGKMCPFDMMPHFLYEEIEEGIEREKANWEADPEKYKDSTGYYPFYRLPREQWPEKICDHLVIGSDYGAGVVTFGIRIQDLDEDDPPVYMNHEADDIIDWNRMYEHLSDYLLEVVLTALACIDYSTAQDALEKAGWEFLDYEEYEMNSGEEGMEEEDLLSEEEWQEQMLKKAGIDLHLVRPRTSACGQELFFCQDEEKGCFYLGNTEDEELRLTILSREGSRPL